MLQDLSNKHRSRQRIGQMMQSLLAYLQKSGQVPLVARALTTTLNPSNVPNPVGVLCVDAKSNINMCGCFITILICVVL